MFQIEQITVGLPRVHSLISFLICWTKKKCFTLILTQNTIKCWLRPTVSRTTSFLLLIQERKYHRTRIQLAMESRLEEIGEFWSFVDMLVFQHGAIYYNTKYYKLFPQVITSSKQMFSKGLFVL